MGAYEYQNQAPTANAGADQSVTVPHDRNSATNTAAVTLNGSGADPEGNALSYRPEDQNNATVGNAASVALNLTAGSYTFTLTVTDAYGASASSVTHVTVSPEPNRAPSLSGRAQRRWMSAARSPSRPRAATRTGDPLTYSLVNSPAWASINRSTGVVTLRRLRERPGVSRSRSGPPTPTAPMTRRASR